MTSTKFGEPVAAVERGKRVIVCKDKSFEVADHDFTKFSLIPSVILEVDIPKEVSGSWYRGQVHIGQVHIGQKEYLSPHHHKGMSQNSSSACLLLISQFYLFILMVALTTG